MSVIHWTNVNNESPSKFNRQSSETLPPIRKRIQKRNEKGLQETTYKSLYKQNKLAEIVTKAQKSNEDLYEEYDEIKIQGSILKINDNVIIKNGDHKVEDYVGTIQKICSVLEPQTNKLICLCQVQWFLKKSEIVNHKPRARCWIGTQEIFSTKKNDYILAQTIIQKCQVVNCDEFVNLENSDLTTYYNRLEWDVENKKFTNMNEIQLYCLCQQPWNPELNYIQCDKCQKWYHFECVDLIDGCYDDKEYICGYFFLIKHLFNLFQNISKLSKVMKISQLKFKTKKPIGLTLDYLENQQPQKEILPEAQEINQFDDIFNQHQQQSQKKELYPLNQSKSSNFEHCQNDESSSSKPIHLPINEDDDNEKVQKIIFEEYYPQNNGNRDNSENTQIQQENLSNINSKLVQEPPAPKNKDKVKSTFPQKGSSMAGCKYLCLSKVKKQIQIAIPEVKQNITSSYEQTMIKQQQKQNQMNDLELKSQIFQLQNDKDRIKNQYELEIVELNALIQDLQTKLEIEQEEQMQLKQQNQKLSNLISQIDNQLNQKQDKEQLRFSHNNNLNDKEKICYLIEKLNVKSTQNAKLHYEIIKLQNNVEMLETQSILNQNNANQNHNQDKQAINQVPQYLGMEVQQPTQIYNKKENIKASVMMQQKQSFLNLSANHSQLDQNKNMNFSNVITPQANKNEVSTSIHKNLTLHQTKNGYFKEDNLQQIRKIQYEIDILLRSTKNSTSVGELNILRQDPTNYSNILQNMMKKAAPNSPNKYLHATQKFKETLDSKLNNISDKQKSYASLLFSGSDLKKSRYKDAYCRQYSPHINDDIQFKTRQQFLFFKLDYFH
ncbi:unnamed protein product (macronuclear) [Paramecium tetraurelia]|uniref:BAH domain-containing protein n=1 Tax=Paramecium tetraurelia TaxID=5888 RepID=A0BX56_PARTE|nr:uncharacterized protein GSPATT00032975001 [Paramecium tetraurelia]CAK63123.1 unnamed protein product [Paramecium tetraurelia]|eukprot:XP_001430521.1 hypothetical protein (macronuclear) [Paramecium tetraurelia strain d4-2]